MENPNVIHELKKNKSTGPKTPEGKARSSQNARKHNIFTRDMVLVGEEKQEEFDTSLANFAYNHKPVGPTEESLVRRLAETDWRMKRIPNLEAMALDAAIKRGDTDFKCVNTFGTYSKRLASEFDNILKSLHAEQEARLLTHSRHWRQAVLFLDYHQRNNLPWEPTDHGFVFSKDLVEKQLVFNKLWQKIMRQIIIYPTVKYQDEHFSDLAL